MNGPLDFFYTLIIFTLMILKKPRENRGAFLVNLDHIQSAHLEESRQV